MVHAGGDCIHKLINMITRVCWLQNKRSIGNMKLHIHMRDLVLCRSRLSAWVVRYTTSKLPLRPMSLASPPTPGLGRDALGVVALILDKVVVGTVALGQGHLLEPYIEDVLLIVGEVHVNRLALGVLDLEAARLEVHQDDDMIIARISTERLGHPAAVEGVAVLVLLAIGNGGQIVRDLCILFFGSGALDRSGFLGREET
jgi:hypothetical protein